MFFVVVGTHTEYVINEFASDARINILICQCHTVTNGTDLRRSPHLLAMIFHAKMFHHVRRLAHSSNKRVLDVNSHFRNYNVAF